MKVEYESHEHGSFSTASGTPGEVTEMVPHSNGEPGSRVRWRTRMIKDLSEKLSREERERSQVEEDLRHSRKMLQLVMDNIPQEIFWKDLELCYLGCNRSFAEHAGLNGPSEIVGRDDRQMPWRAAAAAYQAHDRRIIERNCADIAYEESQVQADGSILWFRKSKFPLHDRDGRVIGLMGTIQDITESRRIKESLIKKEKILAEAQSIAHMGSWEYCLKTHREYRSLEFYRILGIPAEKAGFATDSMFDYIHPMDREFVRSRITETLEQGKPYDVEYRIIRPDGSERSVHAKGKTIRDEHDRATKFIGAILDITTRKQTEDALLFTQFSVDQAAIPVFWITGDGRLMYANHACGYLGYSAAELSNMTIFDIDPSVTGEIWERDWKRCTEKEVVICESNHRTRDGLTVPVQITAKHMENKGREYCVAFVRDISRRKMAEEKTAVQLRRLASLRTIDTAITGSLDLSAVLAVILDQAVQQLGADAAGILTLSDASSLEHAADRGFKAGVVKDSSLRLGTGVAGRVARERRTIHLADMRIPGELPCESRFLEEEGFVAYYGVPLIAKGKVVGVMEIYFRYEQVLGSEEIGFLETLARQTAIAIDNATLFSGLQQMNAEMVLAYDSTLEGWSPALDLRDKESEGHSRRVTELTLRLARAMGIRDSELIHIRRGAILHDIGKMGIPDAILLKPGPLDAAERVIMEKHPVYAYEFLAPTEFLQQALNIPYCHHEKWNGSGYPRGLREKQIPLSARIFSVVDVWDALCSDRPYRPAWSPEKARVYIRQQSGTHFDPLVVEAFMGMLEESG